MAKEQTNKTISIEDSLDELDTIVTKLEDDDTSLEDSFKIYEQGMKMVKNINSRIDKYEKKLIVLDETKAAEEDN